MTLAGAKTCARLARSGRIKAGIATVGVAGVVVALAPAAVGSAATLPASRVPAVIHGATTETFGFTGAPVRVRVPEGAAGVMVTATGGGGGKGWAGGNASGSPAGSGGIVTGFTVVRPDEQAEITVGGKGTDEKADPGWGADFGGGRGGSHSGLGGPGGGGGGASTFSLDGRLLIVAGAGGGGGSEGALAGQSGGRGGSGVLAPRNGAGANGGGGSGLGSGSGGTGSARTSPAGGDGGNGGNSAGGGGGGGGGLRAGDGGGGGRLGGGGGGGGGAGGSAVEAPAGGASFATAKDPANGQVTLTWLTNDSVSCRNLTRAVTGGSALTFKLECAPESTALTYFIVAGPVHGAIGFNPETGALAYTPRPGFTGTDSFTYTATNGLGHTAAPATVTLLIASATAIFSDASTELNMDGRGLTIPGSPIAGSALGQGVSTRWQLKNNANGTVSIINATSGLCVGPAGAGEPGAALLQQTCDGATIQQFTAAPEPGGVRIFAASGFPLVFRSAVPGTPLTIGELHIPALWQLR
jgi:Bacterial Ig domain/Ricin-type beta-trefoil lectin domain-like